VIYQNESAIAMMGWGDDELVKDTWVQRIHHADVAVIRGVIEKLKKKMKLY